MSDIRGSRLWPPIRLDFDRDQGRNETMAMMAMMWCVISDLSASDQDVLLTFETWTSGQPESWIGVAFSLSAFWFPPCPSYECGRVGGSTAALVLR